MYALTILAVWAVSWVEWFIAGRKGVAMFHRRPSFSGWACLEAALGLLVLEAWKSDWSTRIGVALAVVAGCLGGTATSSVWNNGMQVRVPPHPGHLGVGKPA